MTMVLDLKKSFELNLEKAGIVVPTLQAKLAVDKSGSMSEEFESGIVDKTINLFIAAALKFDDNGELDVGFFNTEFDLCEKATAADVGKYLKTKGRKQYANSGTNYAGIIEAFEEKAAPPKAAGGVFGKLFGSKPAASTGPAIRSYTAIITDGDCGDKSTMDAVMAKTSGDTFFQFIAIGEQINLSYITKLTQRFDHVGLIHIRDPYKITPETFYEQLCNQTFANWIKKVPA